MKIKSKLFKDAKRLTIVIPSSLDKKLESFCAKSGHMKSFVVSRAIETLISEANHACIGMEGKRFKLLCVQGAASTRSENHDG